MNEKEHRARIDRLVAEEEHTYGRLLELRDQLDAIAGELDRAALSPTAGLPNISNIVALPSRFRREGGRRLGAMTVSESQSTGCVLDTNVFNRVVDHHTSADAARHFRAFG
jgi:hypothetical protein